MKIRDNGLCEVKSEGKHQERVYFILLLSVVRDYHGDNNSNDGEDDDCEDEADPPLLPCRTCRDDGFLRVLKTRNTKSILCPSEGYNVTYPASVSFSTSAAVAWMVFIVSSCCSTNTLICATLMLVASYKQEVEDRNVHR